MSIHLGRHDRKRRWIETSKQLHGASSGRPESKAHDEDKDEEEVR
jgi:hypothetical protein